MSTARTRNQATTARSRSRSRQSVLSARSSTHGGGSSTNILGFDSYGLTRPFRKCEQIVPFLKRLELQSQLEKERYEELMNKDIHKISVNPAKKSQANTFSVNTKQAELEFFRKLMLKARYDDAAITKHLKHVDEFDKSEETVMYGNISKGLYKSICNDRRIDKYGCLISIPKESKKKSKGPKSTLKGDVLDTLDLETFSVLSTGRKADDSENDAASSFQGYATARYSRSENDATNDAGFTNPATATARTGTQKTARTGTQLSRTAEGTDDVMDKPSAVPVNIFGDMTLLLAESAIKDRLVPLKTEEVYHPPVGFVGNPTQPLKSMGYEEFYSYDGEWNKGQMEGYGHYEYLDGGFYEGQYLKNKYNGQGVSRYPNHFKLSKEKSDTKKVDKSSIADKKSVVNSTTVSNEKTKATTSKLDAIAEDESGDDDDDRDQGEDLVKDGSSYEGQYQSGRFHGQGFLKCRNASEYRGAFREGRRDGYGTLTLLSGLQYEGEFFDGRPHGHGKVTSLQTGYMYEGNFNVGSIEGVGVLTTPTSKRVTQNWPERRSNDPEISLPMLVRYYLAQCERERYAEQARQEKLFAPLQGILLSSYVDGVREDMVNARNEKKRIKREKKLKQLKINKMNEAKAAAEVDDDDD